MNNLNRISLPIDAHLPKILETVEENQITFLKASPGSGKTTRVPPYLLGNFPNKTLILEPRRLAAKTQATRMAQELGEKAGLTIGYMFKGARHFSAQTKVLFVTEGTMLRLLKDDPLLSEFSVIILDEFHERHLETDMAYYFLCDIIKKRTDLKLIFMSATLELSELAKKHSQVGMIEIEIPPHPISISYLPNTPSVLKKDLSILIRDAILEYIQSGQREDVGILVFLPGRREIENAYEFLSTSKEIANLNFEIEKLYGDLTSNEQSSALEKSNRPKIILSTNIAESSLTIPYVNCVIDSGLYREMNSNPIIGFGHLQTKKISKASAIQRAGRSNRTGPGFVYRLFSELDLNSRPEFSTPEILRAPLHQFIMEMIYHHGEIHHHYFLTTPPDFHLNSAFLKLKTLDLIHEEHEKFALSNLANTILNYPLTLRMSLIAHFGNLLNSHDQKELLRIFSFLDYEEMQDLKKVLKTGNSSNLDEVILRGFLDTIGRVSNGRLILHNGETFELSLALKNEIRPSSQFYLLLDLGFHNEVTTLYPIELDTLKTFLAGSNKTRSVENFEIQAGKKKITKNTYFGNLLLDSVISYQNLDNADIKNSTEEKLRSLIEKFKASDDFIRVRFFEHFFGQQKIADFDEEIFVQVLTLELEGVELTSSHETYFLDQYKDELLGSLNSEKAALFNQLFPTHMQFSDRRSTELFYSITNDVYQVKASSLIQDFYGLKQSPLLAEGKIQLVFELLGPHKRALQVTKDLMSFWKSAYKEMFKELSRDYPRHHWPLEPENAKPILLKRQLPEN